MAVKLDSALAVAGFVPTERHERLVASAKPLALQSLHRYNRDGEVAFPSICCLESAQLVPEFVLQAFVLKSTKSENWVKIKSMRRETASHSQRF